MPFVLLIPFLFILILLIPLKIKINYSHIEKNDNLKINILLFNKITGLRIRIPFIKNKYSSLFSRIQLEIYSFIFRFIPGKNKISLKRKFEIDKTKIQKIEQLIEYKPDELIDIIFSNLNLKCDYFQWKTIFGFENPALTGISNGLFWNFKIIILSILKIMCKEVKKTEINVKPNFDNKGINTHFKGIFSLFLGNIIFTVLKLIKFQFIYIRTQKRKQKK